MTPKLIESLLHEDEGSSLDFKRDQYMFDHASNEEKSELLKDILAFCNSFRRSDAYILIGVDEVRGGKSKVVGVSTQLDDAKLQQFVNSKTQSPATFSYHEATHDNHAIGIIHIPVQTRPNYSKITYGKVQKEIVYLRRGSSTDAAKPEEVALMGPGAHDLILKPSVELYLIDRSTGKSLGTTVPIDCCTWYEIPPREGIPDYNPIRWIERGASRVGHGDIFANGEYLRELAMYLQTSACFPISLEILNKGETVVLDANLVLELHDPKGHYQLLTSRNRDDKPVAKLTSIFPVTSSGVDKSDVNIVREAETWRVQCRFGKVQPRAAKRLQYDLFIGSRNTGEATISGLVYADNIGSPVSVNICLSFQVGSKPLTVDELERIAAELAAKE